MAESHFIIYICHNLFLSTRLLVGTLVASISSEDFSDTAAPARLHLHGALCCFSAVVFSLGQVLVG